MTIRRDEPWEPVVAGVVSALKSLRTRSGLRWDRLAGTELPLDVLSGLEDVRAREADGTSVETSIIEAIRDATKRLDTTSALIVDATLALELSEQPAPKDLYSEELGKRREALLANWKGLHVMHGVQDPPAAPSLRVLRLEVEKSALESLARVLTVPEEISRARGAAVMSTKSGEISRLRPAIAAESDARTTIYDEFRNVAQALRGVVTKTAENHSIGWRHDLNKTDDPPTALATAYGLKTMLILESGLPEDMGNIPKELATMAVADGGWSTRAQTSSRPEVTAVVLDSLSRANSSIRLDRAIKSLHNTYGEFERFRPFIMATMLETLLRVDSNSTMTETVVQDLLASRQRDGEYLLWPEKSEPSLTAPSPSVVHTARALRSLSLLQEALPSSTYAEAISQAVDWLLTYDDFQPASEILDRSINHRTEPLYIRHFTAAWVLKALVATGVPTSHQSVQLALGQVWDNLNLESHLWRWPNGDLPIWMTFDAIEALHVTALASISRPPITTELIGVS